MTDIHHRRCAFTFVQNTPLTLEAARLLLRRKFNYFLRGHISDAHVCCFI